LPRRFRVAHSGWCLTADEIIANVQKKYAGLTSLTVAGKAVSDMDMSGVPASDWHHERFKNPGTEGRAAKTPNFDHHLLYPPRATKPVSRRVGTGR